MSSVTHSRTVWWNITALLHHIFDEPEPSMGLQYIEQKYTKHKSNHVFLAWWSGLVMSKSSNVTPSLFSPHISYYSLLLYCILGCVYEFYVMSVILFLGNLLPSGQG